MDKQPEESERGEIRRLTPTVFLWVNPVTKMARRTSPVHLINAQKFSRVRIALCGNIGYSPFAPPTEFDRWCQGCKRWASELELALIGIKE